MAASTTVRTADELARRVVRKIAPEELSSFDIVAAPYLESPKQAERRLRQAHDDPLGFGLGDVVAMATPVIALVSGSVITAVSDNVGKAVSDGTTNAVRKAWRKLRGKPVTPLELPSTPLTTTQLAEVRQIALERALSLGMEQQKADALADAVIAALVLRDNNQYLGDDARREADGTSG
ncbi:hypothetical protein SAMN04488564_103980 [Lentzea waywayandensis]|uniref:Uncharacterized protein n=1 Tax=Lentzea waywayandensis TaxID=84724 RepID=A0A1I6E6V4_9PSEU|nr:hypothetical protein [Lentzea waywayandensis]SFR13271.1 hypothetical protein SAMN04488564_103980 [Lentzea waywayandensis]